MSRGVDPFTLPAGRLVNLIYFVLRDLAQTDEARKQLERLFKGRFVSAGDDAGLDAPWWFEEGDDEVDVAGLVGFGVLDGGDS